MCQPPPHSERGKCPGRHECRHVLWRILTPTPPSIFFIVLAVYATTLNHSVAGGDSGELVAAACSLGVPHPPGYPLHTMRESPCLPLLLTLIIFPQLLSLLSLFPHVAVLSPKPLHITPNLLPLSPHLRAVGYLFVSLIPYGTPAARCNLLSASCSAAACSLIFSCINTLSLSLAACPSCSSRSSAFSSATAALVFAFSDLTWRYSTHAEVFSLNNLFAALLCHLTALHCTGQGAPSTPYAGAFVIGLGLTNQHTLVLVALPMVLVVLFTPHGDRSLLTPGPLLTLTGCFLWGLAPYAYLPWAAERSAPHAQSPPHAPASPLEFHAVFPPASPLEVYTFFPARSDMVPPSRGRPLVWSPRVLQDLPECDPPRGRRAPNGAWGDCSSLEGLITHITRKEYGTLSAFHSTPSSQASCLASRLTT